MPDQRPAASDLDPAVSVLPPPALTSQQTRGVLFALNDMRCIADIRFVTEIERAYRLTHVPGLPAWVLGVTNLHGEIVSVVDLARFLGLELPPPPRPPGMLLVAQAGALVIGLRVDRVERIVPLSAGDIQPPPPDWLPEIQPDLFKVVRGVITRDDQLIYVLDCDYLLLSPVMQPHQGDNT